MKLENGWHDKDNGVTDSSPPSQDDDEEVVGAEHVLDQREQLLEIVRLLVPPHQLYLPRDLERELAVPRHGVAHIANLKGITKLECTGPAGLGCSI